MKNNGIWIVIKKLEEKKKVNEFIFQVKNVKALVVDDNAVNLMIASNVLMHYHLLLKPLHFLLEI